MKRISEVLLSLTLVIPYIFLFYHLCLIFYYEIIRARILEVLGLIIMGLFIFYIMAIGARMLIQDLYLTIKNNP